MKVKEKSYDVGVIVGRFQVPFLHPAHKELIQTVLDKHPKVIVFLGVSHVPATYNNPLDFESRKKMLLTEFPDINVLYIQDTKYDTTWSKNLDASIKALIGPTSTAVIYGSRDSFIPYYSGNYSVLELEPLAHYSGTELRNIASKIVKNSEDFRAGVIWAVSNQYTKVLTTVDCIIYNENYTQVLLGRKEAETEYRFVGGFSDVKSESFEADILREIDEETHITVKNLQYLGSMKVQDWRYRSEKDQIKTLVFSAIYEAGKIMPDDDIVEARWFNVAINDSDKPLSHYLVTEHQKLWNTFGNQKNRPLLNNKLIESHK